MAENSRSQVIFGKYELGRLLGCGAFAKVYHARVIDTGQSVAVKIINKKKIAGSALASNIKREISVMRRLNHPRIVKLFEVLATKTKIFFIMEFVKGGELFRKVAKGRFSEDLSRRIFQQLISAIGYCHSRGVFHRDLKPENLLVDENGDLKVSDFGLSAVADGGGGDSVLHTLCGTPAYVAPEILAKKGYDGAKVDIWSSGVVLFVLVAGYLPFNDPNLMAMYKKIYKGDFKCPKWISPDLRRFLRRILDTNPDTRITVDEIFNDPWFQKGYKELKFHEEGKVFEFENRDLNAFDIICFSPGLDLSGLFEDCAGDEERFVVEGEAGGVLERVLEVGEKWGLKVKWKKEMGLELEEMNGEWNTRFEFFRLVDGLVLVEVFRRGGDSLGFDVEWKKKLKPELLALVDDELV